MKRKVLGQSLLVCCLVVSVRAHDLFLKFDTYFLRSNSQATVRLLNGSFRASEGVVARATSARTDANGIVRLRLGVAGKWFVKMIHMTPVTNGDVNYESKWATLTFEVRR